MSKFQSTLAEAAYVITNHGFVEDEFGSVDEASGWNALVVVTPTVLLNLGEDDVHAQLLTRMPNIPLAGYLVWVREDSQGFVDVVDYASDEGLRSGTDLLNEAWNKFVSEQEDNA